MAVTKSASIDALMESAIRNFALHGFEGASLRDIAQEADVPLSTIDRYFGSKASLFCSVLRKVWLEVERERDELFERASERNVSGAPLLPDLIHALAQPIVRRARSKLKADVARTLLLRTGRPEELLGLLNDHPELNDSDRHLSRWLEAIAAACPDLERRDVVWTFSFLSGLIYSRQLIDRRFSRFLSEPEEPTIDQVTGDIVTFGVAGINAIVAERCAKRGRTADQAVRLVAAARSSAA